jgi:hypothetical protein
VKHDDDAKLLMISVGEVRHALVMFTLQIHRLTARCRELFLKTCTVFNCKTITRKEKRFLNM